MATIKSYTDISQSKKLVEILPLESADMCWFEGEPFVEAVTGYNEERAESHRQAGMEMYPCWSLAALLDILSEGTRLLKSTNISSIDDVKYHCDCPKGNIDNWFNNPVDACVAMIEKLHELNLL